MSLRLPRAWPPSTRICRDCLQQQSAVVTYTAQQRRRIGTKYLAKKQKAEDEWQDRAEAISRGDAKNLFDIFEERGFIKDLAGTKEHVRETMRRKRVGAYVGIDPTAASLHIGHLLPLMALFWMYMHGHLAISLIGGATGKVGDPTDRLQSREAMSRAVLTSNIAKIHFQLKKLWVNVDERARHYGYKKDWGWNRGIVNNAVWWTSQSMMEVLQRLGSTTRIGPMLSRDTVKNKMARGDGMSFAEFTYPLLQGWDWWKLFQQRGVQMQIGGSDQYGNIVTGIDALKTCIANEPNKQEVSWPDGEFDQPLGFTVPLLTDSSGAKFGKSAGNAMWLDPFSTSPYDLYGYFMRRPDADIEQLLKLFTFLPLEDITTAMALHKESPSKRVPHHLLAVEVLSLVHGVPVAKQTQSQHQAMYNKTPSTISESSPDDLPSGPDSSPTTTWQSIASQLPTQSVPGYLRGRGNEQYTQVTGHPTTLNNAPRIDMQLPLSLIQTKSIARILYAAGLADSVSNGHRIVLARGAYIGGSPGQPAARNKGMTPGQLQFTPVVQWFPELTEKFLIDGKILILRKGKHNLRIVEVISDEEWKASGRVYRGQPKTGKLRLLLERLKNVKEQKESDEKVLAELERDAGVEGEEVEEGGENEVIREEDVLAIDADIAFRAKAKATETKTTS